MRLFILSICTLLLSPNIKSQSVVDIDGNVYTPIIIGHQVWLKENLKATRFSNGDSIPTEENDFIWQSLSTPAYCNSSNDTSLVADYGRLYNWFAVADTRNICPVNWHVPTKEDWIQLTDFLAPVEGKLNETGNTHWIWANGTATNSSGFTALPGGFRAGPTISYPGEFNPVGGGGYFWSSTEDPEYLGQRAFSQYIYPNDGGVKFIPVFMQYGQSVRCIRDQLTSVNKIDQNLDIQIYPNPSPGRFQLVLPDFQNNYTIEIYTLNGTRILKQENHSIINLTDYPKQTYVLKVYYLDRVHILKVTTQ